MPRRGGRTWAARQAVAEGVSHFLHMAFLIGLCGWLRCLAVP